MCMTNQQGVHHFQMSGVWYHTKYRPGTEKFLQTVSKYYELHIVTFGEFITTFVLTFFLV